MDFIEGILNSKASFVAVALIAFLAGERLFPAARSIGGIKRVGRNLSLASINAVLSWAVVVPLSAVAADWAVDWRPIWWSGWIGVSLDILFLDLWIYWWHRANHEVPLLWRFHAVHHLDEFLDASSALRFHFGEVLLSSAARAAVILLAGVPLASVVLFETLLAGFTMFHHSNLRLPQWLERPLSLAIVTPSIHWVHHHKLRADTDSNYSTLFSWWDRLFGSRSRTIRYTDMKIGAEGYEDETLFRLIGRPFRE